MSLYSKTALVALERREKGHLLVEWRGVVQHGCLLVDQLDHIPQGEVGLGLTVWLGRHRRWYTHRWLMVHQGLLRGEDGYLDGCLDWHRSLVMLGNELLGLVDCLGHQGIFSIESLGSVVCHALLVLHEVLVEFIHGRDAGSERAVLGVVRSGREGILILVVIVVVIDDNILGSNRVLNWSSGERAGSGSWHSEAGASHDAAAKFWHGDAHVRVWVEDVSQDIIEVIRQRQDGLEEAWRAGVRTVGRVLDRSLLPRVAATCQVDQDNTKAPDIIGCTHVVGLPCSGLKTLGAHVKGGTASVVL